MRHGSLFSGIGGFELAAQWLGWENVFHCEWNSFGQKVLHHYWPNSIQYTDITQTDFTKHYGKIDILTGGFPCQPYSSSGLRRGKDDPRHLWPHMLRAIREISPSFVVGENVRGLTNWNGGMVFNEVCAELEAEGYSVAPFIIPAAAVNAPHGRDRVWFVAKKNASNSDSERLFKRYKQNIGKVSTPYGIETFGIPTKWETFPTESAVCSGNDGLPKELDGITFSKWRNESVKAYGNAIVPNVAFEIFKKL
jgi:DNA (cytosine-5)-methyltransferase 1